MRIHPTLFLQACVRFGLSFRRTLHIRSSSIVFSSQFSSFAGTGPQTSFVHGSLEFTRPIRRRVHLKPLKMVKTQEGNMDESVDSEAMVAKGKLIMQRLEEVYPKAPEGFLDHTDAFTLLIAVVLSAQSLDVKVNEVTPHLFEVGGTPETMRDLGETKIREIIKQIGLAPQKAKNIAKLSHMICENFDGQVPDTFEGLESLPGVGHKTASVVMMQAFKKPAFPVDTHIHRLACRWGCGQKSVEKTEAALKMWFPDPSSWGSLHTRIILFGREYCPARKHDMDACPICSFAATDEARAMNRQNQNKFVAAKNHKNPFSIRDVPKFEPGDSDPIYSPVKSSPRPKKRKTGTRTAAKGKEGDANAATKTGVGRRRKAMAGAEVRDENEEAPTRRPRKARKGNAIGNSSTELETGKSEGELDQTKKQPMRSGGPGRKTVENQETEKGLLQANGEAPRRSSRTRTKKEINGTS